MLTYPIPSINLIKSQQKINTQDGFDFWLWRYLVDNYKGEALTITLPKDVDNFIIEKVLSRWKSNSNDDWNIEWKGITIIITPKPDKIREPKQVHWDPTESSRY